VCGFTYLYYLPVHDHPGVTGIVKKSPLDCTGTYFHQIANLCIASVPVLTFTNLPRPIRNRPQTRSGTRILFEQLWAQHENKRNSACARKMCPENVSGRCARKMCPENVSGKCARKAICPLLLPVFRTNFRLFSGHRIPILLPSPLTARNAYGPLWSDTLHIYKGPPASTRDS